MSLLQDLVNGKAVPLSDASTILIQYRVDANVMSIDTQGKPAVLSQDDVNKLIALEGMLRVAKGLESKV